MQHHQASTTTLTMPKTASGSGSPATIARMTSSSEFNPRGPNQASANLPCRLMRAWKRLMKNAAGRADEDDEEGKESRFGVECIPRRDQQRSAKKHKGEQHRHLGRGLAVFDEAVAEFGVHEGNGQSGRECRQKPAAANRLRGGKGDEGDPDRVEGFVVVSHELPAAHLHPAA